MKLPLFVLFLSFVICYGDSPDKNFKYSSFGKTGIGFSAGYSMNWTVTSNDLKNADSAATAEAANLKKKQTVSGAVLGASYDLAFHNSLLRLDFGLLYSFPANYKYSTQSGEEREITTTYLQPWAALGAATPRSGGPRFYFNTGPMFTIKMTDGESISKYSETYAGIQAAGGLLAPVGAIKVARTVDIAVEGRYTVIFEEKAVKKFAISAGLFI
ncbi:MAG: hypothetical protein ACLFQK_04070 [Fibrobacterota bacterium]